MEGLHRVKGLFLLQNSTVSDGGAYLMQIISRIIDLKIGDEIHFLKFFQYVRYCDKGLGEEE